MRKMMLAVSVLVVLGIGVYGQVPRTSNDAVSLSLTADSIDRRPPNGYDGVIRSGPAENVTTATGHVLLVINGIRITTDKAVWHSGTNAIDIGQGAARLELPGPVTGLHYEIRR